MDKVTLNRILDVYDASLADPVYTQMQQQYKHIDRKMTNLLEQLPGEQQNIIMDHIAATAALHRRLMELACATYAE